MPDRLDKLAVIWSSADAEVARSAAFMYARNSLVRGWWHQVRLIVWGPSAKTLAFDADLQLEITALADAGVEVYACKACAQTHGVDERLERIGVQVMFMGQPLTDMLKQGWRVITF